MKQMTQNTHMLPNFFPIGLQKLLSHIATFFSFFLRKISTFFSSLNWLPTSFLN